VEALEVFMFRMPTEPGAEMSFSTLSDPHEGHGGAGASRLKTIFSYLTPHSWQRYSKMGMAILL
jgi:hypothetical protein